MTVFDQYGELVLGPPSVNHPEKGVRLDNAHNNYRGGVKCEHSKANGYGFVDAIFSEDFQGIDPTLIRGVFLERSAQCLEVLSFDESITPFAGQCAGVEPAVVSVVDLPNGTSLARSGVGSTREDFDAWYQDDRGNTPGSGYMPIVNNYQSFHWAPPETKYSNGTTNIGMLEIPKPRNSIVKALMDSGWTKPPRNVSPLKVAKVGSVTDDLVEDDEQSSYIFYSNKLRTDFF